MMVDPKDITYEKARQGLLSLRHDYGSGFGDEIVRLKTLERILNSCANHGEDLTLIDEEGVVEGLVSFLNDIIESFEKGLEHIDKEILEKMVEKRRATMEVGERDRKTLKVVDTKPSAPHDMNKEAGPGPFGKYPTCGCEIGKKRDFHTGPGWVVIAPCMKCGGRALYLTKETLEFMSNGMGPKGGDFLAEQ
jgi:hypothetical protein